MFQTCLYETKNLKNPKVGLCDCAYCDHHYDILILYVCEDRLLLRDLLPDGQFLLLSGVAGAMQGCQGRLHLIL
ncbi:hypothetical protein DPMN_070848 [Dreissena polymorpha]|uniref:Uncharacterized protein n=1 Tax=Dreissena polymorpha TaxID=45954 RepID=A0A9D3Z241_DREPO|nr:hypothetical protein DPMN_070848 [Dreissena polymorpha]